MLQILQVSRVYLIYFLLGAIPLTFLLAFIEKILFRKKGVKLSFKVSSRPLTILEHQFLQNMTEDISTKNTLFFYESVTDFIRIRGEKRFISPATVGRRRGEPYIGLADLAQLNPQLEYRAPLFLNLIHLLITLLFLAAVPLFGSIWLFSIFLKYISRHSHMRDIDNYLQSQINGSHQENFTNPTEFV